MTNTITVAETTFQLPADTSVTEFPSTFAILKTAVDGTFNGKKVVASLERKACHGKGGQEKLKAFIAEKAGGVPLPTQTL